MALVLASASALVLVSASALSLVLVSASALVLVSASALVLVSASALSLVLVSALSLVLVLASASVLVSALCLVLVSASALSLVLVLVSVLGLSSDGLDLLPVASLTPLPQIVANQTAASLYCRFKNSRELFDGYKHHIQMEYVETGVLEGVLGDEEDARPELSVLCQLVVNNVMSDDCGEVECRAFNSGGMDSTTAQLYMRCTSVSHCSLLLHSFSERIHQTGLQSNIVIGTLVLCGWSVIFDRAKRNLRGSAPRSFQSLLYQM